ESLSPPVIESGWSFVVNRAQPDRVARHAPAIVISSRVIANCRLLDMWRRYTSPARGKHLEVAASIAPRPHRGRGRGATRRVGRVRVYRWRDPHPARYARHPLPRCGRGVVLDVERLAAAAAALFVGIAEDEAGLQLVLDIVHLAAEDEQGRLGVD